MSRISGGNSIGQVSIDTSRASINDLNRAIRQLQTAKAELELAINQVKGDASYKGISDYNFEDMVHAVGGTYAVEDLDMSEVNRLSTEVADHYVRPSYNDRPTYNTGPSHHNDVPSF